MDELNNTTTTEELNNTTTTDYSYDENYDATDEVDASPFEKINNFKGGFLTGSLTTLVVQWAVKKASEKAANDLNGTQKPKKVFAPRFQLFRPVNEVISEQQVQQQNQTQRKAG